MEIKLSDINSLKKATDTREKIVIIVLGIILATTTWYILKSISTVLVIEKDNTTKKICDLN
jgi:hypothetical protein